MKHVHTKKEMDKQVVQAVVRKFGPVSRVQIHELTRLLNKPIRTDSPVAAWVAIQFGSALAICRNP
jgi:hypothetical protein